MKSTRSILLAAALLRIALDPGLAVADEENERKGRALFAEGMRQVEAGDFDKALLRFEQAYALFPSVKLLLNIAGMLGELGRNAEAANAYARYLGSPEADPAVKPDAEKRLAELDAQLARLQIERGDPGMRVLVDGKRISATGTARLMRVEPGTHTIVGEKDGAASETRTLTVAAGEVQTVKLEPSPLLSHEGQIGAVARLDVEGHGRGLMGVFGLSYGLGERVELGASALVGANKGIEPGGTVFILKEAWKPMVSLGAPIFFRSDGVFPGVRVAAGLAWDPSRHVGVFIQAALAVFPSAPQGFDKLIFLPALGVQARY